MTQYTKLAAVLSGLVQNVDLAANELAVNELRVGGGSGTLLTKTILDGLIANSHASGSDNQDVVAGAGLTGGGTGATTTLDVGAGSGISVSANAVAVDSTVVRTNGANVFTAAQSHGGFLITNVADPVSAQDAATRAYVLAQVGAGGLVKISATDTTSEYLDASLTAGSGLSKSITNPGANEQLDLAVNVDGSTIEINADALRVKDGGITNAKIATGVDAAKIGAGTVSNTEFGYIDGVTSSIQTQLDGKVAKAGSSMDSAANITFSGGGEVLGLPSTPSAGGAASSKTYTDTQDALKVSKSGDTMSGNLAMGNNKITGLLAGSNANDAVNYAQLSAMSAGLLWLDPIQDPDLIDANRATQPAFPTAVFGDVYIAGTTAGSWTAGHAYFSTDLGNTWIDLLGRAVISGDRFGVSMESATAAVGVLSTFDNNIATINVATPGSITVTLHAPAEPEAVYVQSDLSTHFGHQYTYHSAATSWIEFGGISALNAGIGLSISGNVLSVNLGAGIKQLPTDEVGIDFKADGAVWLVDPSTGLASTATDAQLSVKLDAATLSKSSSGLKVSTSGISATELASDAVTTAKILDANVTAAKLASDSVTTVKILDANVTAAKLASDSVTTVKILDANVTAAKLASDSVTTIKILDANVTLAKLASASVDENKLTTSVAGNGLAGGGGTALSVNVDGTTITIAADTLQANYAPMAKKTMVAGETFAADTSFLVRMAVSGETAGRVYKADQSSAAANGKFWALGMAKSVGGVSAGGSIDVTLLGTHTLGASDTAFGGTDIGKAVWLSSSTGGFSVTAPSSSGDATFKVGTVETTTKVFIDGKQLTGIA